tara:strand:+ start:16474 stop:17541 length:1068 start_codon:yes stop_codon:yes gene_type:complete
MKKFIKNLIAQINYLLKNQKIPDILNNINIETTSRCNLKCKFCAYNKRDLNVVPHETMNNDFFIKVVNQALEMGYKNIGLTPQTGDIFMDKEVFTKFEYLDQKKNLEGYYFYTNFIPLNNDKITKIFNLNKLKNFGISIYGYDKDSYQSFSGGAESSYYKLINNLNFFYECLLQRKNRDLPIEISQRAKKNFNLNNSNSELSEVLKKILSIKNVEYSRNSEFNNWGGIIKEEDVKELNIKLNDTQKKKIGSCSLIYSRMLVGANGLVNACACRDANFTLAIGDLKVNKLHEIINLKNSKYKDLIMRQEQNDFPSVCKSCDFYKSIYQDNDFIWSFRNKKVKHYSLRDTLQKLENR